MTVRRSNASDRLFRWTRWAAPLGGIVFVVLWWLGEAGRWRLEDRPFAFVLIGAAIALAPFLPRVSLASLVVVPALQALGLIAGPTSNDWPVYLGFGLVLVVVAMHDERRLRLRAAITGVFCSVAVSALMVAPDRVAALLGVGGAPDTAHGWASWAGGIPAGGIPASVEVVLAALILLVGSWGLGAALRYWRREQQAREVLAAAERELAASETARLLTAQRQTIADDVHDVLAHSLTVIIAQLDGAIASGADHPVLERVSTIARESLVDVRALIERLDQGESSGEAAPSLEDLDVMIDRFAAAGLRIELRESGPRPELADGLQLTVRRILQESLTNALKHQGRGARVGIGLDWRGDQLALRVFSAGGLSSAEIDAPEPAQGADAVAESRTGIGIGSMQTRARMAGGWLTAEADGDEFMVTAVLPQRVVAETVLR
ncbi:hypothetical protein J4H92_08250 [Leucobacter weissii]|uniref:histidine kinase n=1 Tax=Leucobacter weissii TaxID=1983706 RepID=A0A939MJ70_9MICO|nr:histidine kinase [Leucobacter weissii]MBO1901938.1 hypothetical protein [Leucobacter weissii]